MLKFTTVQLEKASSHKPQILEQWTSLKQCVCTSLCMNCAYTHFNDDGLAVFETLNKFFSKLNTNTASTAVTTFTTTNCYNFLFVIIYRFPKQHVPQNTQKYSKIPELSLFISSNFLVLHCGCWASLSYTCFLLFWYSCPNFLVFVILEPY